MVDTFLVMRRIPLTAWPANHEESGPAHELSIGWMENTMKLVDKYIVHAAIA